ncbi:MAG: DAK2 domain-containing protein, partial [bacterium]
MLRRMFLSGAKNLEVRKNYINELNVFPVPDGDTGTNMTLTILSAATEVSRLEDAGIEDLAKAISSGSLRGARGNSGVILSQLLRGFTKVIRDEKEPDVNCLVTAMEKAVETAYKAVMKPKEGTILTVARMMAEKAAQCRDELGSLEELFELVLSAGDEALAKTPELLPVLKEAGVVDSGGAGLMTILHGAVDAFNGLEIQLDFEAPPVEVRRVETPISTDEITFGYCTEFIVKLEKEFTDEDEEEMKDFLLSLGDSLVFVTGDGMVKVHVHTNHPGKAFEKGLEYGQLTRMKVDNMREEHEERLFKSTEVAAAREREKADQAAKEAAAVKKDVAFVAVTIGDGLADLFRQLGCDVIIEGGQTMNPSTEDMLDAIKTANAKDIFILPNNKNVVLAANQAADITETEDPETRIHVIPTRTVPQGISALISYVPEQTPEENAAG